MHLFFVLLIATLSARAQSGGTVRGTVTLKADRSPLHHATVVISKLGRNVQSREDGTYEFQNVPPGRYEIVVHMHALTAARQPVEVAAGGTAVADFQLAIAPVRQELTVTASGVQETTLESFQAVTSLEGHELRSKADATSLGALLENETGIAKRSFGPGTSRPVVRGFDGDRVLVMQDGMRSGTLSSQSGDHGEPVDATAVERVEVVRGPGTLLYGSNAIGGVVNVLSSHHQLDEHPHEGVRGSFTALGSTTNGQAGGSGNVEFGLGAWLLWASGGGQRSGDYNTPIGRIENSATRMEHATAGAGRYADRGSFTMQYNLQNGRYGVPFAGLFEGEPEEQVDLDWQRHNVRFNGTLREPLSAIQQLSSTVNYSDWRHNELADEEIGTRFFNKQFTWQSIAQQQRKGRLSGSFGLWGMHRDFKSLGEEALAPPVKQNSFAAFAVEEVQFEHFRLQGGLRLERNSYNAEVGRDRSFTGASAGAGIWLPLGGATAFVANYNHSYRAPALEELYNLGPHIGNLTFEIGNQNLRRERADGIELALRRRQGRLHLEANVFYHRMKDFVYLAPTGGTEDSLIEAEYDQADARFMGAEARLDAQVHPNLWLRFSFDAVDAELRNDGQPLPRIPPVRGRAAFDYSWKGFQFRPELVLANRQNAIFPTETPTAGYATANLQATYTIARQHVMHTIGANFFNVGDRLYRNHLSFIKELAPEMGRGLRMSYTVNFY